MKNSVLLLLLGSIASTGAISLQTNSNINQKNKETEQAVTSEQNQGQNMIDALASTHLEMSEF